VDDNAIMMDNKKKKKGASSGNPSKVIVEISLPQEGDVGKPIADVNKHVVASNVVTKVIKVAIGKDQSLSKTSHLGLCNRMIKGICNHQEKKLHNKVNINSYHNK
jgi:hypothetical protein